MGQFDWLTGTKGKSKKLSTLSADQEALQKLIREAIEGGDNALSDIFGAFDKGAFDEGVAKPALKQFQEEVLPMLQEKYIANNQVLGTGMQRAQAKAGAGLQSNLAKLMYEAQQQQKQNKIAGVQTAYGKQAVENTYQPGTEGALYGFVKGAGEGLGKAAGTWLAG